MRIKSKHGNKISLLVDYNTCFRYLTGIHLPATFWISDPTMPAGEISYANPCTSGTKSVELPSCAVHRLVLVLGPGAYSAIRILGQAAGIFSSDSRPDHHHSPQTLGPQQQRNKRGIRRFQSVTPVTNWT